MLTSDFTRAFCILYIDKILRQTIQVGILVNKNPMSIVKRYKSSWASFVKHLLGGVELSISFVCRPWLLVSFGSTVFRCFPCCCCRSGLCLACVSWYKMSHSVSCRCGRALYYGKYLSQVYWLYICTTGPGLLFWLLYQDLPSGFFSFSHGILSSVLYNVLNLPAFLFVGMFVPLAKHLHSNRGDYSTAQWWFLAVVLHWSVFQFV